MKALDIALKDLKQSFRSVFMIGMTVIAPLVITGLLYLAFGGFSSGKTDLPRINLGIVNQDREVQGQPFVGKMMIDMFKDDSVRSWLEAREYPDETSAQSAVDNRKIGVAVFLPVDLSEAVFSGQPAQITIVHDPTLTIAPSVIRDMIGSLVDGITGAQVSIRVLSDSFQNAGVTADPAVSGKVVQKFQTWFVDFQRSLYHGSQPALILQAPGQSPSGQSSATRILALAMSGQMIFFAFFTGAYAMMSILREDEEGTLPRLFTTPTPRTTILTGKMLTVLLTVILQSLVLLTVGCLVFQIRWGDPLGIILAILGQVLTASGLGVLVISFVKTTKQAGVVLGGILTALGMLGGLFTASVQMPAGFATVNHLTPQGWVMEAWKLLLNGANAQAVLLPFIVCTLMGCVFFAAGALIFRRRYA